MDRRTPRKQYNKPYRATLSCSVAVFEGSLRDEYSYGVATFVRIYCPQIFTLDLPYMHEYNYTVVAQYI